MWEIFLRAWFFIIILPYLIVREGFNWLKNFLEKRNIKLSWIHFIYVLLATLVILLIVLLAYGYPW